MIIFPQSSVFFFWGHNLNSASRQLRHSLHFHLVMQEADFIQCDGDRLYYDGELDISVVTEFLLTLP